MASSPTTQKALKVKGPGMIVLEQSAIVLRPGDDEVLVRVVCVALNPVDAKSADLSPSEGATLGCDFAGEVVAVGDAVGQNLIIGDRVFGCVFGNNPLELQNGAFAEYVVAPGDLVFRIPPDMSFATAATLAVGLSTVGLGLYHTLKLPLPGQPTKESATVLIYGGGTATGSLAIQMLRRSGLVPVVVCSPRSFDLVKSLGAAEVFDYNSPSCGSAVQEFTNNSLGYALDCISNTESMKICYSAIGKSGGKYVALDPFPIRSHTRRSVKPDWIIAFTIFNKPIRWQKPYQREAKPKDRAFAQQWYKIAQSLLDEGAIKAHPHELRDGGLEAAIEGIDMVRTGKVAGKKLVYSVGT